MKELSDEVLHDAFARLYGDNKRFEGGYMSPSTQIRFNAFKFGAEWRDAEIHALYAPVVERAEALEGLLRMVYSAWQAYKKIKYQIYAEGDANAKEFAMRMPASEGALEDACCAVLGLTWRQSDVQVDWEKWNPIIAAHLAAIKEKL